MVDYSFFKNKKILITGDTGFKGSWLSMWLYNLGADVYGYALPPENENDHFNLLELDSKINHTDGDILDVNRLNKIFSDVQPEIVFHLAAQALVRSSYLEPKKTFDTNVSGSLNVLEAIRETKSVKSVIYVTSDKCYKNKEWIWGYRENDELGGHDPYSASKAAAEILFSSYMDSFFSKEINRIGLASVRAGNVIGGGDWALDRIIPDCIRAIMSDETIKIRNPLATRPWQHVLEPLSGYLLLSKHLYENPEKFSGSWNFGPHTDSVKTVQKLAYTVTDIYGKGSVAVDKIDEKLHEAGLLHLNCDKAIQKLSWKPVWNYEETLSQTVNWYIDYSNEKSVEVLTTDNINKFMKDSIK
ncbi:MAG: CDP-glucose 4,6-dehydratase [Candidatus Paceibacterota bacterium]